MITFSGPSCQRHACGTGQSGRYVFENSLIKSRDEVIYVCKKLVGSFDRDTSFDRTVQRTKNRS
jgi:hypothetical protein